jgi:hypothetical protein
VNQRLVAGLEDLVVERGGDALARGRLGRWRYVSMMGPAEQRCAPTVVLPGMGNLAQLGDALELGVEVEYVLAVEALAGLDEVKVVFLELAELDDMVFGALELRRISMAAPFASSACDAQSYAPA